ncbi:MAG: hypothetical protein QM820_16950 [Minicystis sp.]
MKRAFWTTLFALLALLIATPAWAAPIRLWHAYRDDELKALEAVLALWKGEPIDAVSIPYDAYQSKVSNAVPLGEGPDSIHQRAQGARRLSPPEGGRPGRRCARSRCVLRAGARRRA